MPASRLAPDETATGRARGRPEIQESKTEERDDDASHETDEEFVLEMNLPGFTEEDVEVNLEQGVLKVRLPKAAEARARKIEIKGV